MTTLPIITTVATITIIVITITPRRRRRIVIVVTAVGMMTTMTMAQMTRIAHAIGTLNPAKTPAAAAAAAATTFISNALRVLRMMPQNENDTGMTKAELQLRIMARAEIQLHDPGLDLAMTATRIGSRVELQLRDRGLGLHRVGSKLQLCHDLLPDLTLSMRVDVLMMGIPHGHLIGHLIVIMTMHGVMMPVSLGTQGRLLITLDVKITRADDRDNIDFVLDVNDVVSIARLMCAYAHVHAIGYLQLRACAPISLMASLL